MFAVARAIVNRVPKASTSRISVRSFAEAVQAPSVSPSSSSRRQKLSQILKQKVPVREDHGLWGFFRKNEDADKLEGEAKYEVFEDIRSRARQTGECESPLSSYVGVMVI